LAEALLALKRVGVTDRGVYDAVLRNVLVNHPRYLGVWSVWEPDALDGRDDAFANSPGHDESGRFVPLWSRGSGRITVEPNSAYDTGEWYVSPMRKGQEVVVDPYDYPMAGAHRLITTQVAPLILEGVPIGVAGIDFEVARIPAACEGPHAENEVERHLARAYVFLEGGSGAGTYGGAKVSWSSARGQRLLQAFFGEGPAAGGELPRRLRRLLEARAWPTGGAGETLVVTAHERSVSERTARGERSDEVLRLRPFFHHDTGPGLLLDAGLDDARDLSPRTLSAREEEVLIWMSEGKTNAEIAEILDISLHTVKRHVERILQKLAVPNRSAAIAHRLGPKTYWAGPTGPLT
jgi:DNA-binding CsgD family transcriptional regulator